MLACVQHHGFYHRLAHECRMDFNRNAPLREGACTEQCKQEEEDHGGGKGKTNKPTRRSMQIWVQALAKVCKRSN